MEKITPMTKDEYIKKLEGVIKEYEKLNTPMTNETKNKCCEMCIKHPESDLICKGFCPCHSQDSKCEHHYCLRNTLRCCKCDELRLPTEKDPVECRLSKCKFKGTEHNICQQDPVERCPLGVECPYECYKKSPCNSENVQSWGYIDNIIATIRGPHDDQKLADALEKDLKQFISTEIQRAVESDRLRVIEVVSKVCRTWSIEKGGFGALQEEILNLISKK